MAAVAAAVAVCSATLLEGRFSTLAAPPQGESGEAVAAPPRPRVRPVPPPPTPGPTVWPSPPPPTPTPRPNVNLAFFTPPDWAGCVVCNFRWLTPPVYEFLSVVHPTHVVWTVGNNGTSSVFGPLEFGLLLDGSRFLVVRYENRTGLLPGAVLGMHFETRVTSLGRHELTVAIDPDDRIREINEADNACAFTGVWTAESIVGQSRGGAPGSGHDTTGPSVIDLGRH